MALAKPRNDEIQHQKYCSGDEQIACDELNEMALGHFNVLVWHPTRELSP